jgi:hypothetical protein
LEPPSEPLIRNISDTARWVAVYRARETERPDAHFRDPFARRLAGERGEQIAKSKPLGRDSDWSMITRTCLGDQFINEQVQQGVDMVVNLAAGLDARPYRMVLPASLKWVEVDLPEILAYKEEILRDEKPVCSLERIRLDLSNVAARRDLLGELGRRSSKHHRGSAHLSKRPGRCRPLQRPRRSSQFSILDSRYCLARPSPSAGKKNGQAAQRSSAIQICSA